MITGGSSIASLYLQPNIGSDVALLTAIGKALLELDALDREFIASHTSDFDVYLEQLQESSWAPRGLLIQMEKHYHEHSANVKKKFVLADCPAK